jgi:hypothetical protein
MGIAIDKELFPGVRQLKTDEQVQRYMECVYNPVSFARYAKLKDAATNAIIPMKMWPHIEYMLWLVGQGNHKWYTLFKAKQLGCSWGLGIVHLWLSHRLVNNTLVFSKGEDYAADLVDKSVFVNQNMPEWLQLEVGTRNSMMVTFPKTQARIKALPSTEDAGVGETASWVTRDELEFHQYAEQNYAHVAPTIADSPTAVMWDQSTSKRAYPNSHMKQIYRKAVKGENNYFPMFFHALCRPDRSWEWLEREKKNYPVPWMAEQDYPTTIDDCLGAVQGMGLFDKVAIDRLLNKAAPAREVRPGGINIYHYPDTKFQSYAGADIAEGRGNDYSVLWIEGRVGLDRYLLAIQRSNTLTPDKFALFAVELLRQYGSPRVVCGADPWGQMFLSALKDLHYFNLYNTKIEGDKLGYIENADNKQENLLRFSLAVQNGLDIPYMPAIEEMFGWNVDEKGRWFSTANFDDCIIAACKADFAFRKLVDRSESVNVKNFY